MYSLVSVKNYEAKMVENNEKNSGNYCVEHTVVVDEYIEIKLKIPKMISAIQLKGLMMKVDKIFKLSESQMSSPRTVENQTSAKNEKYNGFWTKEKERILRSKYGKVPTKQIAKEIGTKNTQKIHQKIHYMKKMNQW